MGRRRLPRRFPGTIPAYAALAAALVCLAAPDAHAQMTRSQRQQQRDSVTRTVIGLPYAQACAQAAVTGDASDQALASCDRSLRNEGLDRQGRITTLGNRGTVHLRRREGDLAVADFEAVIALDPRNAEAHLNRGAALVMTRRADLAVAAITEALSLGVREPHKAYYNRGAAREALGDVRGAYEDYSTALQIEPDWGPANAELARFVRSRRDALSTVLNGAMTTTPAPN